MRGEGFKLSVILILCFMIISLASMYMLSMAKIDIETLKQLFEGIGILAGIFGVGPIIAAFVVTRGQTSGTALPARYATIETATIESKSKPDGT